MIFQKFKPDLMMKFSDKTIPLGSLIIIISSIFFIMAFKSQKAQDKKEDKEYNIAIATFWHETKTFHPFTTTSEHFERLGAPNSDILDTDRGFIGGFKNRCQEYDGINLIGLTSPNYPYGENTGGWVSSEAFEKYMDLIITDLRKVENLDGVYLDLHGAMATKEFPKAEVEIVRRVRKLVGDIPIIVTLDLHGNEDADLAQVADAVLIMKTYPHYDMTQIGEKAARVMLQILKGKYKPVMAVRKPKVIIPGSFQRTEVYPAQNIMERARSWEYKYNGVHVSVALGYAYSDVPEIGASVFVLTNNDQKLADSIATDMSDYIWSLRKDLSGKKLPDAKEGVRKALGAVKKGLTPVVLANQSARIGGSTHVFRELLDQRAKNFCVAGLQDRVAVNKISEENEIGDDIKISVGGDVHQFAGKPVEIKGSLHFIGQYENIKTVALKLEKGNYVILTEKFNRFEDPSFFDSLDIDINSIDIISLKSINYFRVGFEENGLAKTIIPVDPPGLTPADLTKLPYENIPTDLFPLQHLQQKGAKRVEDKALSTGNQFAFSFTPDAQSIYLTKREVQADKSLKVDLLRSDWKNKRWTSPVEVKFNSPFKDADSFISPGGSKLFFMSQRPIPGTEAKNDYDIWYVEKNKKGIWGKPQHLGSHINTHPGWEGFPTVSNQGTLYFFSEREGGQGQSDIYRSQFSNNQFQAPENLGARINSDAWDGLPYISPNETFMIFQSERLGGYGKGDLYISYQKNGEWTQAKNLGPLINTSEAELFPHISPDGQHFYFTRFHDDGSKYVYYIPCESISIDVGEDFLLKPMDK